MNTRRHKWGKEDASGNQHCLNGCGTLRCDMIPNGPRANMPVAFYKGATEIVLHPSGTEAIVRQVRALRNVTRELMAKRGLNQENI